MRSVYSVTAEWVDWLGRDLYVHTYIIYETSNILYIYQNTYIHTYPCMYAVMYVCIHTYINNYIHIIHMCICSYIPIIYTSIHTYHIYISPSEWAVILGWCAAGSAAKISTCSGCVAKTLYIYIYIYICIYICGRLCSQDHYNQIFGVCGQHLVHLLVRKYSNVMLYSGTRGPGHPRCVSNIKVQR
jgi:hypothetical protein